MSYDPNQAHPKIDYEGTYPNLHVTQRADGSQEIRSLEPGKESFFVVQPSGSYEGHGPDGQRVSVTVDKSHNYSGDGVSQTIDGHSDTKVSGTTRSSVDGSSHTEIAGNAYTGSGGVMVNGSQDSQINTVAAGDRFETTEGNVTTDHTGHVNHNTTGDVVNVVNGNKIDMVSGETMYNNQDGNMDIKVDGGKYRLKVSESILIDSDTSITLKVGSSVIVIDKNSIVIKAAKVDINP